jgi:signal transduction histidine kinase
MIARLARWQSAAAREDDGVQDPVAEHADSPDSFPLLRYYLITSLLVITVITIAVAFLFVKRAEADFTRQSTERAGTEVAHLVQILFYSVWAPRISDTSGASLRSAIDPDALNEFARNTTFGLDIVDIKIIDTEGDVLWSSEAESLENFRSDDAFLTAITQGTVTSELRRSHAVVTSEGQRRQVAAVRVFYPMRDVPLDSGEEGSIIGVLHIDKDVTEALARTRHDTLIVAVLGSIGSGVVLFALLFLIVFRADRIITRGRIRAIRQRRELEEAQAKHVQSARLAAVGELVSGVAHELNNPLTSIWGLSQLLTAKKGLDPAVKERVDTIGSEAERAVRIVKNLLSFARGGSDEKTYTSINEPVEAVFDLRKYSLMVNNIALQTDLQPGLPMTMADPYKIQQVTLNLMVNAEQAMEEAGIGDYLRVTTETRDDTLQLVVSDNGPGVAEQDIAKLFDPFFTTKEPGKGTGLGLSICYGIVRDHGGTLSVQNESPHGARFTVELPIVAPGSDESTP